jgi:hypothetical protein
MFNSDELASHHEDNGDSKPALKEVLKVLSRFLQKKGEITKKTLDGIIHEVLTNDLFPNLESHEVIDVTGKSITIYTISNGDICDKVMAAMDGTPTTIPNEYAFYTTDYGKITQRRILKICRDRFSASSVTSGSGTERYRGLVFDKDTVEKTGKTFEITPEIKIIEDNEDGHNQLEGIAGEHMDMDNDDGWDIPIPFQFRSTENTKNHAQNGKSGTVERNFSGTREKSNTDIKERRLDHISERGNGEKVGSSHNSVHPSDISVPSFQGNSNQSKRSIYRLGHSDRFACHNCKKTGDRWFMGDHECNGKKKS